MSTIKPNQMESFTKFAGLDGVVALVTGGATGIGSAIVENFLRQGSHVVFLDKNAEAGRELVARLTEGAKTIPEFVSYGTYRPPLAERHYRVYSTTNGAGQSPGQQCGQRRQA